MASSLNQQLNDPTRTLKDAIASALSGVWTALPCEVTRYDPDTVTVELQPTIQGTQQMPDGSIVTANMPLLLDVPVVFPHGGGCTMTFPINVGDECLAVFSSRCIDAWWQLGGVQSPMENRKHDLSDAFAIFGPQSQPKKIGTSPNSSPISTDAVQIRSDDGQAIIELNPTNHNIKVVTPTDVSVTAATVNLTATTINSKGTWNHTGTMTVSDLLTANSGADITGNITHSGSLSNTAGIESQGDIVANGISLEQHKHALGDAVTSPPL